MLFTMTELCRYGADLFPRLQAETGLETGFKRCGSLPIARTHERLHEIGRLVSLGKVSGVEAHMVSPNARKAGISAHSHISWGWQNARMVG
jgi:glycine/D-amino acid oxidase-like deaminating enzyme